MIIDIHNHPDWHGYNAHNFIENMDLYNIDKTWILTWECPFNDFDHLFKTSEYQYNGSMPFEHCLAYYEKAPNRFVLGYAPDIRRPEAFDLVAAAVKHMHVRVLGEVKLRMDYDNPDALRIFRFCGENGVPVILDYTAAHSSGRTFPRSNFWSGGDMDSFERILQKCPDTIFLGHDSGFWAHYFNESKDASALNGGRIMKMLDRHPNLYCDISGPGILVLSKNLAYTKEFFIAYEDRVLYGRDYVDNIAQEMIGELGLQQGVLDKLYYKNALKLVPDR